MLKKNASPTMPPTLRKLNSIRWGITLATRASRLRRMSWCGRLSGFLSVEKVVLVPEARGKGLGLRAVGKLVEVVMGTEGPEGLEKKEGLVMLEPGPIGRPEGGVDVTEATDKIAAHW